MKTCVCTLILAAAIAIPHPARAERSEPIVPPPVPDGLELSPQEYTPFLVAHAVGTQGYVCVKVGAAYNWVPYGPQATLFNEDGEQVLTHFLSPRPYDQLLNATWQHSRDSSAVWAQVLKPSDDPNFVAPDAIPWLLLEAHRRRRRTDGWRQDGQDPSHSACEHGAGKGADDRVRRTGKHREAGPRAVRSRLLLLQEERASPGLAAAQVF